MSKSLVSLVMRDSPNVSDQKRQAVLDAARELGYRPNAVARSLVRQRTQVIGVMVSDFGNPFFSEMLEGVEEAAVLAGYRALFNTGSRVVEREVAAVDSLLQLQTDGLILASPQFHDGELTKIPRPVPTVMVGRDTRVSGVDVVMNDDRFGAQLVVDHLVDLGHRRIAHIHGAAGAGAGTRLEGFLHAMASHGLNPITIEGGFTEQSGIEGAGRLLELQPMPTAVFAANDISAMGVMQTLEGAGFAIPDDISLVGYDNVDFTGLDHIDLTTVDQPRRQIGTLAVEMLLERIDGARKRAKRVTVEPRLVERGTTASPAG